MLSVFNKGLWGSLINFVSIDRYPRLNCPYCNKVELDLDIDSFVYRNSSHTSLSESHLQKAFSINNKKIAETFEKDKLLGIFLSVSAVSEFMKFSSANFTSFFHCHSCDQNVSATGSAVIPKQTAAGQQIRLKVEYFSPTVPMFPLHPSIPASVRDELLRAFNYFHSDLTASGAKIRRAIEQFCAELGFQGGTLHSRIEKMEPVYPIEAEWLRSVKLLGNEAAHSDNVDEMDLLHSFEILEEVLEIFRRKARFVSLQEASRKLDEKFKKA